MFDILQYDFMIRAFLAGMVIACIAPLIGNFLVVRKYSLMADTLAHVSLLGVAIGLLFSSQPILFSIVATIIAAILIDLLRQSHHIAGDSVLAIFLSGSLAIAIVIMSAADTLNGSVMNFLFGSITTVSTTDVWIIALFGMIVIASIFVFYKNFFLIALDEDLAKAAGIPVQRMNILFSVLTAVTVSLSMRIVGALLIGALMIIPTVAATQARKGFAITLFLSLFYSLIPVITGLVLSYYYDVASGGTIVVCALIIFVFSLVFRKK